MKYTINHTVDYSGHGNYSIADSSDAEELSDVYDAVEEFMEVASPGDIIEIVVNEEGEDEDE